MKTFASNVTILAVENCIVSQLPNILTPDKIYGIPQDTVEHLAAESLGMSGERSRVERDCGLLQSGLDACIKAQLKASTGTFV